jgi:hypothetical protein
MFERIKALLVRWQQEKEVSNLSDEELYDMGMTRDQVMAFVRMPADVPDRVAAMAEIFGLTDEQLHADHGRYMDLLYTCGQCRDRGACRHLLDQGDFARPEDADFCGNKYAFGSAA